MTKEKEYLWWSDSRTFID